MKVKLAEALLRRKELQGKVDKLRQMNDERMYAIVVRRKKVSEDYDEITAQVPRLSAEQVLADYNWHCKQLRLVDAVIQQANWTTEVEVTEESMGDYQEDPKLMETSLPMRSAS